MSLIKVILNDNLYTDKLVKFVLFCLDSLPFDVVYVESSKLTILFFCLGSLAIVDKLNVLNNPKNYVDWIKGLYISSPQQTGFASSYLFTNNCDSNIQPIYNYTHLTMTLSAILSLKILASTFKDLKNDIETFLDSIKLPILNGLKSHAHLDGSFGPIVVESERDVRFIYCASAICAIYDDFTHIDTQKCIHFIMQCLTYEGAFGQVPNAEAHGGSTFCAIASLYLLLQRNKKSLKVSLNNFAFIQNFPEWYRNIVRWCFMRANYYQNSKDPTNYIGFNGRPNKDTDSCYTFWIGATLNILSKMSPNTALSPMLIQHEKLLFENFIENSGPYITHYLLDLMQDRIRGGFKKDMDVENPDPLHTYLSLCALTLISQTTNETSDGDNNFTKLKKRIDPALIMPL